MRLVMAEFDTVCGQDQAIPGKVVYYPINSDTDDARVYLHTDWIKEWNHSNDMVFVIAFATLWSWMEVEIEGKDGWAIKLPTSCAFLGWTWYHISMNVMVLLVLYRTLRYHRFPYLYIKWSVFVLYVIAWFVIEDLMWFILNRNYGIRKYNVEDVPWHANKPWFAGTFVYNWVVLLIWIISVFVERHLLHTMHLFYELCISAGFLLLAVACSALSSSYYDEPTVSNDGCFS